VGTGSSIVSTLRKQERALTTFRDAYAAYVQVVGARLLAGALDGPPTPGEMDQLEVLCWEQRQALLSYLVICRAEEPTARHAAPPVAGEEAGRVVDVRDPQQTGGPGRHRHRRRP
jgi:hypothetical protein